MHWSHIYLADQINYHLLVDFCENGLDTEAENCEQLTTLWVELTFFNWTSRILFTFLVQISESRKTYLSKSFPLQNIQITSNVGNSLEFKYEFWPNWNPLLDQKGSSSKLLLIPRSYSQVSEQKLSVRCKHVDSILIRQQIKLAMQQIAGRGNITYFDWEI